MTRIFAIASVMALSLAASSPSFAAAHASQSVGDTALTPARAARDTGDSAALQKAIDAASADVAQHPSAENYVRVALLEDWLCEIAQGRNDANLIKSSAQTGVAAAEKAVQLNPNSSEAHWLIGDLLAQLIPHVLAGGVRYGARSSNELDKAIALDPKNAAAYVSRATSYYFTPAMFGGDKQKAVEFLDKAIALDPSSDAADTAHIWLARIYNDEGKHEDAVRESAEALRLNPNRGFAKATAAEVAPPAKASSTKSD